MKSKTSFFDLTVFRKDITRFAPVWVLYTVGGVFLLLQTGLYYLLSATRFSVMVAGSLQAFSFLNLIYALVCALLLFGDLFNSRLCNALHAMPMRRECWFVTHFAAGVCFSLVPNLAFGLLITLLCGIHWYLGPIWLASMTLQYLFFFSLAAFAVMCAGKKFAATAVYLILNFLSFIVLWFISTFYSPLLPGIVIDPEPFALFCPVVTLIGRKTVEYEYDYTQSLTSMEFLGFGENWPYLWIIGGVGLVFATLALLLYRKRHLESAGDFVAARAFTPVFTVIYTLSVAAITHLFFGGISLFLPVSLAIGYFTGQMLLQRKVNVFNKRSFIGYGLVAGITIASIFLTWLDPAGITRWTPQPEQVVSVTISDEYGFDPDPDSDFYADQDFRTLTESDDIRSIIELHETILEENTGWVSGLVQSALEEDWNLMNVYLVYTLEDGRQVIRQYDISTDSDAAAKAKKFFHSPEYILGYEDWDSYLSQVSWAEVNGNTVYYAKAQALVSAIKADCELGRMGDYWVDGDGDYEGYVDIYADTTRYIRINSNCQNTINWLNENVPDWDD